MSICLISSGFPPKGHLSTTHPQFPGPHPRDISRRLLAPDDWNPAIQHLVALADPSMMVCLINLTINSSSHILSLFKHWFHLHSYVP